jgi:hypothetical protein
MIGVIGGIEFHLLLSRVLTLAHYYQLFNMGLGFIHKAQCSFISTLAF